MNWADILVGGVFWFLTLPLSVVLLSFMITVPLEWKILCGIGLVANLMVLSIAISLIWDGVHSR